MAFEPINNVNPKSTTTVRVPDDGVLLRPRKITRKGSNEVVRWIEAQGDDLKQTLRRHAAAGLRFEARPNFVRAQFDVGAEQ